MQPKEYEEYRLKSTTAANVTHNVMLLQSQTASFSDFTPPIRLIRDRHYESDEDSEGEHEGEKKPEPIQAGRGKRKRTRILYLEDEDAIALREQESAPWLLEDFDGQHAFNGRLEGGQHSNYVFFVNQGNEFRVLPISRWYRFQPKLAYQPMSLEDAEAAMAKGGRRGGPIVQKKPASASSEEAPVPMRKLDRLLMKPDAVQPRSKKGRSSQDGSEEEDLDFKEFFDDDDEGPGGQADEEPPSDNEKAVKRPVSSLHGKQVKKLVRSLDRKAMGASEDEDDEDEEEVDPYADEDDLVEIADLIAKPSQTSSTWNPNAPKPTPSQTQSQGSQQPASQSHFQPIKAPSRTLSPALSTTSTNTSAIPLAPGTVIVEADVAAALRERPLNTKSLIARLKVKLKADPGNKEVLRELIKRMAVIRQGATPEDDKLLELKPEYR